MTYELAFTGTQWLPLRYDRDAGYFRVIAPAARSQAWALAIIREHKAQAALARKAARKRRGA